MKEECPSIIETCKTCGLCDYADVSESTETTSYIRVPAREIQALQKAREALIAMFKDGGSPGRLYSEQLIHITNPMLDIIERM